MSTTKHPPTPVLLIHGMNGHPDHWQQSGFQRRLYEAGYKAEQIERLDWGRNGLWYNNTGDLTQIAQRLPDVVATICKAHATNRIDIVTYSAGGLVARAYLADMQRAAQPHGIRKLVMIGVPNTGSFWMLPDHAAVLSERIRLMLPSGRQSFLTEKFFGALALGLSNVLEGWIETVLGSMMGSGLGWLTGINIAHSQMNTLSAQQMRPGSELIQHINAYIPADVQYYPIYGDIRIVLKGIGIAGLNLPPVEIELGDLIIDVPSATGSALFDAHPTGFKVIIGDNEPDPPAPLAEVGSVVALAAGIIRRVAPAHNHGLLFVERGTHDAALQALLDG